MLPGSREQKIIDLGPYLPRQAPPGNPENSGPEPAYDFIDLVGDDDAPPPADVARRRPVTDTWQVLFWMLAAGVALGLVMTPAIFLFMPNLPRSAAIPIGFLITAACVVTAYLNYRLVRMLADRLLERVLEETREIFHFPLTGAGVQASEIDRLDEALLRILSELKHQIDSQKAVERNDLIQTITALATALEARDPYTRNHSRSVARLTVRLARRMGLSRNELYQLHLAGLLHDVGKIGVPDSILLKPARLTDEEMRMVESHVEWSYNIIHPIRILAPVSVIVRHHHERWDGKGYPDRLAGEEIPPGARLMAVVDMFMAMTEDRPYRKGLPVDAALAELHRVSGTQLDPACVDQFLELLAGDGITQAAEPVKTAAAG